MPQNKDFFQKVYAVVRQVPLGKVSTYGAVAAYLGSKQSARMVGWAMNLSHTQFPPVPAHRIVNGKGLLTGKRHFASPDLMQQLLEAEGIGVKHDCVENFEAFFWDPAKHLSPVYNNTGSMED